jgi:hypothetical protein
MGTSCTTSVVYTLPNIGCSEPNLTATGQAHEANFIATTGRRQRIMLHMAVSGSRWHLMSVAAVLRIGTIASVGTTVVVRWLLLSSTISHACWVMLCWPEDMTSGADWGLLQP